MEGADISQIARNDQTTVERSEDAAAHLPRFAGVSVSSQMKACLRIRTVPVHRLSRSVDDRPAFLAPGIEAAMDMPHCAEARIARRLHRHRRSFAEGTEEENGFAGREREFVQHAASADIVRK